MLNLEKSQLINQKYTMNEHYGFLVGEMGMHTNTALTAQDGYTSSLSTFEGDRDALSGVSVDEEMTHLIAAQRSFESSAKFVSTIDRLMDVVINLKS